MKKKKKAERNNFTDLILSEKFDYSILMNIYYRNKICHLH